jgi:hypothetical protein
VSTAFASPPRRAPRSRARLPRVAWLPALCVLTTPAAASQQRPISDARGAEVDPWIPEPSRADRKALERLEKERRELEIVAEPAGTVDPCASPEGPNLVNFIRRGAAPGDPTYLFGIDLCSRRPFVYEEPTQSGVIVGFAANPPHIEWAEDPADDRNLRGDRFAAELLVGVDMLFGTSTLDFGDTSAGSVDFAAAPSVGVRVDRFRATFARAVAPPERSWLAKVSVAPFRQRPPKAPVPVDPAPPGSREARTTWFDPVDEPCNADGVGTRGFDHFRMGHRAGDGRYPVDVQMVSFCTRPHRAYRVRTFTDQTWFGQFNNTFPKFAAWEDIPRGGLLNSLSFTVGFGEVMNDVFNVDFPTNVIYVGLGVAFSDSRWRIDAGRLFSNESLELISAGVPVTVTTDGWTVQIQRALHFEEFFGP